MQLTINADGASRGNPGPASYGYIIKDTNSGTILHQEGKTLGKTTNNVAEYSGVMNALAYVQKRWSHKAPHVIDVVTDSLLVASQLAGKYKVKNEVLKDMHAEIKGMEASLGKVTYRNVPRAQNFIADRLANQALDNERIK